MTDYIYSSDSESAVIENNTSADTITFTDVDLKSLTFGKTGTDLIITFGENKTVTLTGYFTDYHYKGGNNVLNQFKFGEGADVATYTIEWRRSSVGEMDGDTFVPSYEGMYFIVDGNGEANKITSAAGLPSWVNAGAGDDIIRGKGQNDMLAGNDGNDKIYASDHGAELYGGAGNDELYGGKGDDFLVGNEGNDLIEGGKGDDYLLGGQPWGATVAGDKDTFVFSKGDGNDIIGASTSADKIQFKNVKFSDLTYEVVDTSLIIRYGNDSLEIENYYTYDEETGTYSFAENAIDTVIGSDGQEYSLKAKILEYRSNIDESIVFTEEVQATNENPDITATKGENSWMHGNDADNVIKGVDGYNMLAGNDGNDTIYGGTGFNEIYAGEGADTIVGGNAGNYIWGDGVGDEGFMVAKPGHTNNDTITGGKGDDEIYGGSYLDVINTAGSGNDTISGGKGDDAIWGGDGNDVLTGGAGKDTFNYTIKAGALNTGDFGNDTITDATKDDTIVINTRGRVNVGTEQERDGWVVSNPDSLRFTADGNDLVISTDDNNTIRLTNFMKNKSSNNLDTIAFDEYSTALEGSEMSILRDATIAVTAGENGYKGTDYNETVTTGAGTQTFTMGKGTNTINVVAVDDSIGNKIVNLTKGETLYLNTPDGAALKYSVDGKDIVIAAGDLGEIRLKGAAAKDTGATVYINEVDITTMDNLFTYNEIDAAENNGAIKGSVLSDDINVANYESTNGKGVKINSKSGNDSITGSFYNDTIKAGSLEGEVATIVEHGGVNKITTGKGADEITVDGLSSNTINAGAGHNTLEIASSGINKLTAGNDGNEITITDGVNNVKTGKGNDTFIIDGGINTIKSGVGQDEYTITGGANTIKTGNDSTVFNIDGGRNVITAGSKVDTFTVTGGNNILKGGKGADIYNVTLGDQGLNFNDGSLFINDKSGANRLNITGNEAEYINLFFDVTAKGKMSNFVFSEGEDFGSAGISVANEKSIESIRYGGVTYHIDINEIKQLAADIAAWLGENNYASTADAIADGQGDVLSAAFQAFAAHDYEFRAANSLMN